MRIGLRIVAATTRGAREGSARLVELLLKHNAGATFYFNLGPSRLHRWLPGRDARAAVGAAMRAVRDAGFEVGVHGWDPQRWQQCVPSGDHAWTENAMRQAHAAFADVFGEPPRTHAAPAWQMNRHALRLTQRLGYHYASDTRGQAPFIPLWDAELVACPQVPTTLPTIGELLHTAGTRLHNVHERIRAQCAPPHVAEHVFTLNADRGRRHLPPLERLCEAWRDLGYDIVPLRAIAESLDPMHLAHRAIATERIARHTAAAAGKVFLAE
jgi:peptidoglycan/xylan/chitin deacetylase (PgdA/CDA1 family)